jgi:hypothetical protein
VQAAKQQAENDAKVDADLKASNAEWRKKLTSLAYMVDNNDPGFKLAYGVCKPADKNAGLNTCKFDGSHDWSDGRGVPYRWFSDMQGCEDAQRSIDTKHPADVEVNGHDAFVSDCVPAPKMSGFVLKGYKVVFALFAPGANLDGIYADLHDEGGKTATVFKTFNACYGAMDSAYSKTLKDLGADEDGNMLNDKTKSIGLKATCVARLLNSSIGRAAAEPRSSNQFQA